MPVWTQRCDPKNSLTIYEDARWITDPQHVKQILDAPEIFHQEPFLIGDDAAGTQQLHKLLIDWQKLAGRHIPLLVRRLCSSDLPIYLRQRPSVICAVMWALWPVLFGENTKKDLTTLFAFVDYVDTRAHEGKQAAEATTQRHALEAAECVYETVSTSSVDGTLAKALTATTQSQDIFKYALLDALMSATGSLSIAIAWAATDCNSILDPMSSAIDCLRRRPPVPFLYRRASETSQICGVKIEKNETLILPARRSCRLTPFGSGASVCPGRSFAVRFIAEAIRTSPLKDRIEHTD